MFRIRYRNGTKMHAADLAVESWSEQHDSKMIDIFGT